VDFLVLFISAKLICVLPAQKLVWTTNKEAMHLTYIFFQ